VGDIRKSAQAQSSKFKTNPKAQKPKLQNELWPLVLELVIWDFFEL
jgi:hypothetical protein